MSAALENLEKKTEQIMREEPARQYDIDTKQPGSHSTRRKGIKV